MRAQLDRHRRRYWLYRLRVCNDKIDKLDALLNDLDRDVWPSEYDEAAQARARCQRRRAKIVTKLNNLGGTQYTLWGTVAPS